MANLTQFTGGAATSDGHTVGTWVGTETDYLALQLVSDPDLTETYDPTSPLFFPNYSSTLFNIYEG